MALSKEFRLRGKLVHWRTTFTESATGGGGGGGVRSTFLKVYSSHAIALVHFYNKNMFSKRKSLLWPPKENNGG